MAYAFNGTNQYISGNYGVAVPKTLFARFYTNALSASPQSLVYFTQSSASRIDGMAIRGSGADGSKLSAGSFDGAGYVQGLSSVGVSATTQQTGAAVLASTTSRTPYLDGTAGTTNTQTNNVGTGQDRLTLATYLSGSSPQELLNGRLADAAVWNVALSADEIASLAKGFKPTRVRPQSLVFYAPLIRDLNDLRGALPLTNNNSATVTDHPRVY